MNGNFDFESKTAVFWGEIAPSEHVATFYEDDEVLLDTLSGFVGGGLKVGDAAIVIATSSHLKALSDRLKGDGIDVGAAESQDQYIPLNAEEALAKFMVKQWPDDELFAALVTELIARASRNDRRVRAFGEMVALLWARGDQAATVRLEYLWNKLCRSQAFSLFCAYPKAGFTQDTADSLNDILPHIPEFFEGLPTPMRQLNHNQAY
ncbi:MAG TPA: MEDS domain-containing protein [Blastocatellia bacterium]|nr:MEDS domain-containing protein [Blastocatellia bacterium]